MTALGRLFGSLVAAIAVLVVAPAALAGDYGMAGCGLGSMLIGSEPGISQIFASTTNGTSGNQTFGISSGTSNCTDSGGGSASTRAFIETNRLALSKDIARGGGETIASLSQLAGCSDEAAVGAALQAEYQSVIPSASVSDTEVSSSIVEVLRSNESLACEELS